MDAGVISVKKTEIEKMDQIPTVAVLMSTYNGEKYIREQLNSIFYQENVLVRLFVRDDGSTDGTVGILNDYAKRHPVEIFLDGENVYPGESFMRLVYKCAEEPGIDYYAFADQDDIWLPQKLSAAVKKIEEIDMNIPILYGSNQFIYINGKYRGRRYKEPQPIDLISHMTKNTIAGCTFVFNKSLARLIADAGRPDSRIIRYRLHDAWVMLVAISCGKVIYDESSYILYRIHENNTVGLNSISFIKRLKRLERLFVYTDESNIRLITAKELLRIFPQIDDDKKQILKLYAYYQNNWRYKILFAKNKEIKANCLENPYLFTLKILLNFV